MVLANLFGPNQELSELAWQPFRPGIEIFRLYGDGVSGPSAALLRYESGARLPEHAHVAHEHIVILSGSQQDEHGVYRAGTVLIHEPDTHHRVSSEHGCVALAIWNAPVQFRESP